MTPGLFDHGLFLVVALLLPLWAVRQHRYLEAEVEAGDPDARIRGYRQAMLVEWALAALVLSRWLPTGQLPELLGAGHVGALGWWIGIVIAAVGCGLLLFQTVFVLRSDERIARARAQIEPLRSVVPVSPREGRVFAWLSITAGICEEILYRGFMIVYLGAYVPLWLAVVMSSLIFGFGHAYQGVSGVLKTGTVGAVAAGLFLLTGALWTPIVAHAFIDLNSGYLGRRVLTAADRAEPA